VMAADAEGLRQLGHIAWRTNGLGEGRQTRDSTESPGIPFADRTTQQNPSSTFA
jgi:hypothetical protein